MSTILSRNPNPPAPEDGPLRVAGYVRVSTNKQEIGPEVQIAELQKAAKVEGWELTIVREDAVSASRLENRPVLQQLLLDLRKSRVYDALAVSKLDRLSRNTEDGSWLLAEARRREWRIICLDLGVDTGTILGGAMFNMALNFAEVERKFIGQRTSAAMQQASEAKHMGRPRQLPPEVTARIVQMREGGMTLAAIARTLNDEGVRTASGKGLWSGQRVQQLLLSRTARGVYVEPGDGALAG